MMTRIFSDMSPKQTIASGLVMTVFGASLLLVGAVEVVTWPVVFVVSKLRKK